MKLRTKFNLGIFIIFIVLASGITLASINWVNHNTIQEAEHRVRLYIRSSWEIYNDKQASMHATLTSLSQSQQISDLLMDVQNPTLLEAVAQDIEAIRVEQNLDFLNLVDAEGKVLLRTQPPYYSGDSISDDPLIRRVIRTHENVEGTLLLSAPRLVIEGHDLLDRCLQCGGEPQGMIIGAAAPVIGGGRLIGILQAGSLLNGAEELVDKIRDAVFENEQYNGKPLGTATIFMNDLRVSTNVIDYQCERAVGTRVSSAVAEQVLDQGIPWSGRAWVVDTWYLSQYDPIRDPDDNVIGMLYVGELEQRYLDMRTQALIWLLSIVLAGLLLAFLVFFMLIRGILDPVEKLVGATQRLSSGDLQYRVPVKTKDEIGHLSKSFNEMGSQLASQRRQIEQNQLELKSLNEELWTINRNYMEMLGFVTHELKAPLASATLSLYTVKDGYLGELNASQKKSLESVASSLDYFSDMIRNYLDLSRLEKGELDVNREPVRLNEEVILPVLEGLERALQSKNMRLENDLTNSDIRLQVDRDLFRIVYDNLISNAIKYGREKGQIALRAQPGPDDVTLCVYNEGPGIPPGQAHLLFKKFSRLNTPELTGQKGTGLGLYICKEIVEKHGGKIWIESEPGQWVKFIFTLPNDGHG